MNTQYAAVRRYLVAQGWDERTVRSADGRFSINFDHHQLAKATRMFVTDHTIPDGRPTILNVRLTTVQDAIDFLVTAGVLPVEFHSLAPTAADHYREIETACIRTGHPLASFYADRNASFCACGAAMDLGDFRAAGADPTAAVDLMAALKKSLDRAKTARGASKPTGR